jgi:hypothetical protein
MYRALGSRRLISDDPTSGKLLDPLQLIAERGDVFIIKSYMCSFMREKISNMLHDVDIAFSSRSINS